VHQQSHRTDLLVRPPVEVLSALVGASAVTLLDPAREWDLRGHWPIRARSGDDLQRFNRFRDLLAALETPARNTTKKKAA
jgi:hypothetical protein